MRAAESSTSSGHESTTVDQRIIYNSTDGTLWYDADGHATAGNAVQFAVVADKNVLHAYDFAIV